MDYALMRLDKRLLPQCHEPNDSELEAAGLTSEGTCAPNIIIKAFKNT